MLLQLPNLDDRRWADLVDEARALIPVYSPGWTDHNESDPGITIMELLAWISDSDIYRANRISDSHVRAFLGLIGVAPEPPRPAVATVQFELKAGAPAQPLPATLELDAAMLDGKRGKFRLRDGLTVLPCSITAVQVQSGGKFRDATGDWNHGRAIAVFGDNPQPEDALYLGFSGQFATGDELSLHVSVEGKNASAAARQRIIDELQQRTQACRPWNSCASQPDEYPAPELPPHHSAHLIWEAQTQPGIWEPVESSDSTRSMTLSGAVRVKIATPPVKMRLNAVMEELCYIRCRFISGSLDEAPRVLRIVENAAEAEQSAPLWEQWTIAPGVVAIGTPPGPGQISSLRLDFDAAGNIVSLEFNASDSPTLRVIVLAYKPATATQPGSLVVEAVRIGMGSGAPNQLLQLSGPELWAGSVSVFTLENGRSKTWSAVDSFVASGAADAHYLLDAGVAELLFGNGENGREPPAGAPIIAVAMATNGANGNVPAEAIAAIDTGPHNTALLDAGASENLARIHNRDAAAGGTEQETLQHAEGRAAALVDQPERAVTLDDCQTLALQTPGTALARAMAIANCYPGLPCYSAPGFITVVIVPHLPLGRPVPSPGLLRAVSAYLNRRCVVGSRIEVVGPDYLEVSVKTAVKAGTGQNKTTVHNAVDAALKKFLDPLDGGPEGGGWPLGRAVYISEILDTIAGVAGVDHVTTLQLQATGCGEQCGDLCLDPFAIAVSGLHVIEVS